MGVMATGNIASRVGIEPTFLAFQASVLIISPSRPPDVNTTGNYIYTKVILSARTLKDDH